MQQRRVISKKDRGSPSEKGLKGSTSNKQSIFKTFSSQTTSQGKTRHDAAQKSNPDLGRAKASVEQRVRNNRNNKLSLLAHNYGKSVSSTLSPHKDSLEPETLALHSSI